MTLSEFLAENPKGIFCVKARRIGHPYSRRIIEVSNINHQDIWVYITNRRGDRTTVEARIDRRSGSEDCGGPRQRWAGDYELI